jgi:hypothetical protein
MSSVFSKTLARVGEAGICLPRRGGKFTSESVSRCRRLSLTTCLDCFWDRGPSRPAVSTGWTSTTLVFSLRVGRVTVSVRFRRHGVFDATIANWFSMGSTVWRGCGPRPFDPMKITYWCASKRGFRESARLNSNGHADTFGASFDRCPGHWTFFRQPASRSALPSRERCQRTRFM